MPPRTQARPEPIQKKKINKLVPSKIILETFSSSTNSPNRWAREDVKFLIRLSLKSFMPLQLPCQTRRVGKVFIMSPIFTLIITHHNHYSEVSKPLNLWHNAFFFWDNMLRHSALFNVIKFLHHITIIIHNIDPNPESNSCRYYEPKLLSPC